MEEPPRRKYVGRSKHKGDFPYASKCPSGFTQPMMEDLLNQALPTGGGHRKLFNVYFASEEAGIVIFRQDYDEVYHGYPAGGHEVPPEIIEELFSLGRMNEHDRRRLLRSR